jgi:hypothetical protein
MRRDRVVTLEVMVAKLVRKEWESRRQKLKNIDKSARHHPRDFGSPAVTAYARMNALICDFDGTPVDSIPPFADAKSARFLTADGTLRAVNSASPIGVPNLCS